MGSQKIKESLVYKKDLVLKSATDQELEEHEYLFSRTIYNEDGKVTSEKQYDNQGELVQDYIYTYNDKGYLIEEKLQEADGFVAVHKSFEVDDKGKVLKEFRHYMDETFDTVVFHYNEKGKLVNKETFDPDNDLESTEEFSYEGDRVNRHVVSDADGDILSEKKTTYDDKGNAIKIEEFDGSVGESVKTVTEFHPSGNKKEVLTYNSADQLIEKVTLKEDAQGRIEQVVEESTSKKNTINFTYDAKGNVVHQDEFDRNGEMIGKVNRVYDGNNNLVSSNVFIHGGGRGLSRNYTLRQEYVYY
jgi:antitoxin component YwqK of YwqJK toxin-antitoxin module